jgi:3-oxoacyl-[acyl-carrier protein] reductase
MSAASIGLDGKVAIVTGASRGIGRGIAERFAHAGASTVLVARTKSALDEVAEGITATGGSCETVVADVTRQEDMVRLVEETLARQGRIDVLCHNVGIYPATPLEDIGLDEWDEVLRTNLTGTFLAVKACLPAMKERRYGRIVLTSSITGARVGYPGLSHYAATKAGMIGFMRTAAVELAAHGITINAVEPGSIRTEALRALGEDAIATMKRIIPMGMLGEPEDVGNAALFLASDAARFVTGQSIVVDGGQILPEIPL